ncbi:hypothetical protein Trydic_g16909 [Trypoxylus dichotomus]
MKNGRIITYVQAPHTQTIDAITKLLKLRAFEYTIYAERRLHVEALLAFNEVIVFVSILEYHFRQDDLVRDVQEKIEESTRFKIIQVSMNFLHLHYYEIVSKRQK